MQVNVYEAKSKLSALLELAAAGEEVVIARAGKPLARLVPIVSGALKSGVRLGGLESMKSKVSPGFHAPTTDADLLGP